MPRNAANRPVRQRQTVKLYSDDNPSTFTVKRKRGEPPPLPTEQTAPSDSSPAAPPASQKTTTTTLKRPNIVQRPQPTPQDTILSHTARWQPTLPLNILGTTSNNNSRSRTCTSWTQPPPSWQPLEVSLYATTTTATASMGQLSIEPPTAITWLERRADVYGYAVTGDTRGRVVLWELHTLTRPIRTIATTAASCRERQRTITSKRVISYPNAIEQCSWFGDRIVVVSASELEILQLQDDKRTTTLWTGVLSVEDVSWKCHAQLASCISMNESSVLFCSWNRTVSGCGDGSVVGEKNNNNSSGSDDTANRLLVWESSDSSTQQLRPLLPNDDENELFCCWTTRFETTTAVDPTFLAVAQTSNGIELLRAKLTERPLVIQQRTVLPCFKVTTGEAFPIHDVSIEIDEYIVLAGRGIRLYDEQLHCLGVFGENVQLHGKSLLWNRCCYIQAPDMTHLKVEPAKKKPKYWMEHEDLLAEQQQRPTCGDAPERWLIGIPHPHKGPEELRDNIYIWKPATHESFTIHAPSKGISNLWMRNNSTDMVALGAKDGRLYELRQKLQTDFAGTMYPVGYQVIHENLEYIEDEDELDQIELVEESPKKVDPDVAEAVRLSLLEQKKRKEQVPKEEELISVLADPDDTYVVPCRPEVFASDDPMSAPSSPVKRGDPERPFESAFLFGMPQSRLVRKQLENEPADAMDPFEIDRKPKPKPKRGRTANVETILKNAIDPDLRRDVGASRTNHGTGRGCAMNIEELRKQDTSTILQSASPEEKTLAMELLLLSPVSHAKEIKRLEEEERANVPSLPDIEMEEKDTIVTPSESSPSSDKRLESKSGTSTENLYCAACYGRLVLHSCGKRDMPIDYEALAREDEMRKQREEAERQRIRIEKRRQTEAKRRETKRRKKLEEQQRLEEQLRAQQIEAEQRSHAVPHDSYEQQWQPQESPYEPNFPAPQFASAQVTTQATDFQPEAAAYDNSAVQTSTARPRTSTDSWNEGSFHSSVGGTVTIDGKEVDKSASLEPMNALEALAGLADKLASPVPVDNTNDKEPETTSWNGCYDNPKKPLFTYSPPAQRRAIVAHAYAAILNEESRRTSAGIGEGQTYEVGHDGTLKVAQDGQQPEESASSNTTVKDPIKHSFGTGSMSSPSHPRVVVHEVTVESQGFAQDEDKPGQPSPPWNGPTTVQSVPDATEATRTDAPKASDTSVQESPQEVNGPNDNPHGSTAAQTNSIEATESTVLTANGNSAYCQENTTTTLVDAINTSTASDPSTLEQGTESKRQQLQDNIENDTHDHDSIRGSLAEQLLQLANSTSDQTTTATAEPLQS